MCWLPGSRGTYTQIVAAHVYTACGGILYVNSRLPRAVALKNVCAVRCFILTFALEMCVREARENALVWGARCMELDQLSFRYYVHSYYHVLYSVGADLKQ